MTIKNFGHWKVFDNVDIKDFLAFTYIIVLEDGRKYAGAKKMWRRIKTPPSSFKRGPKKGFEQSDWMDYKSSSNEMHQDLVLGNTKIKEAFIVGFYDTWGKALYAEALLQIDQRVLSSKEWLNSQIEGQFTSACDDPIIYDHVARASKYLKLLKAETQSKEAVDKIRTEAPEMFPRSYQFEEPLELCLCNGADEESIKIETYDDLSFNYEVSSAKLERLLDGSIDEIELTSGAFLKLPGEFRRVTAIVQHKTSKTAYLTYKDAQNEHGFKTKRELLDSDQFTVLNPQTRSEFKEHLKEIYNKNLSC